MKASHILQGSRCALATCTPDFVSETYVSWLNDKTINRYLESRFSTITLADEIEYVTRILDSDNEILFAILADERTKHIGNVHLTLNPHHKRCFIAYMIGERSYWGKGIATEAIKMATRWAFENLDIARMDGGFYSNNIGSGKAVLRAGYRQEGVRVGYCLLDDGSRVDEIEVGLTREDYETLDYSGATTKA